MTGLPLPEAAVVYPWEGDTTKMEARREELLEMEADVIPRNENRALRAARNAALRAELGVVDMPTPAPATTGARQPASPGADAIGLLELTRKVRGCKDRTSLEVVALEIKTASEQGTLAPVDVQALRTDEEAQRKVPKTDAEKRFLELASSEAVEAFQSVTPSSACVLCKTTAGFFTALRHCGGCGAIVCIWCSRSTVLYPPAVDVLERSPGGNSESRMRQHRSPECTACKGERVEHYGGLMYGDAVMPCNDVYSAEQTAGPLAGGYRAGDDIISLISESGFANGGSVTSGDAGVVLGPQESYPGCVLCSFPNISNLRLAVTQITRKAAAATRGAKCWVDHTANLQHGVVVCRLPSVPGCSASKLKIKVAELARGHALPGDLSVGEKIQASFSSTGTGGCVIQHLDKLGVVIGPAPPALGKGLVATRIDGEIWNLKASTQILKDKSFPGGYVRGHLVRFSQTVRTPTTGVHYPQGTLVRVVALSRRSGWAGHSTTPSGENFIIQTLSNKKRMMINPKTSKFLTKCVQLPSGYDFGDKVVSTIECSFSDGDSVQPGVSTGKITSLLASGIEIKFDGHTNVKCFTRNAFVHAKLAGGFAKGDGIEAATQLSFAGKAVAVGTVGQVAGPSTGGGTNYLRCSFGGATANVAVSSLRKKALAGGYREGDEVVSLHTESGFANGGFVTSGDAGIVLGSQESYPGCVLCSFPNISNLRVGVTQIKRKVAAVPPTQPKHPPAPKKQAVPTVKTPHSASAAVKHSKSRAVDFGDPVPDSLAPIIGVFDEKANPLISFTQAVAAMPLELSSFVWSAKKFARSAAGKAAIAARPGMADDGAMAIWLYTAESPLYVRLNELLRGGDRSSLRGGFFPFTRLLLESVCSAAGPGPPAKRMLNRGVVGDVVSVS